MDFCSGWFKNVVHRDGSDQFLSLELDFVFFFIFLGLGYGRPGQLTFPQVNKF